MYVGGSHEKAMPLSIRVPEELSERLDALAKATDRSKSFLAVQAIEEFGRLGMAGGGDKGRDRRSRCG